MAGATNRACANSIVMPANSMTLQLIDADHRMLQHIQAIVAYFDLFRIIEMSERA
jgi:hypothetical protein